MLIHDLGRFIAAGIVLTATMAATDPARAACTPQKLATPAPQDPVVRVLAAQDQCPKNAVEFVHALERLGARMEPTMVNFVGFHNSDPGAFFFFEIVSSPGIGPSAVKIERGDLFFGHFTANRGGQLVSDPDRPDPRRLSIELIAWDSAKQFYNFYELRGSNWLYQGDSKDILDDVQFLHRVRSDSQPIFGAKLRCSGCHINGGLLQKELTQPHNDWFVQDRHLPLGRLKPDAFVKGRLDRLVDADELSKQVVASARRLADSAGYQRELAARGMQERLRPLFCPMEVNIESDAQPLDDRRPTLQVPSAFFVDPRLARATVSVKREHYDTALESMRSELPGNKRADADHAWLTPVKAHSDMVAVDALIEQGVVDKDFVTTVLAVDFTNPVFSKIRCGLLKLVPDRGGSDFVVNFQGSLRGASAPGAIELLNNLSDPARKGDFQEKRALAFLTNCQHHSTDAKAVADWLFLLAQRRVEVSASEISQNLRGHILEDEVPPEDGRIVFPLTTPPAAAERFTLTPECRVQ